MRPYPGLILGILFLLLPALARCETSELWGLKGEKWSTASRLPDFSFAGYHSGAEPIPSPAVKGNVRDFGAKGDGITDDTQAFEEAIAAVNDGALLVPAGRYVISRVLYIRKSNLVIRGEGPGKTTLYFPRSLIDVLGNQSGTGEHDNWSWSGGFIWVEGTVAGEKLADVTVDAKRGATELTVSSTAGMVPGQMVRLMETDSAGTLGRHMHADQLNAFSSLTGTQLVRFPTRIKSINGNRITLERPLRVDVRHGWMPQIHSTQPSVQEVGIEGLKLEFPNSQYPGHWNEVGANGIWFREAWHSWVRDIAIHNADNGVFLDASDFCTVSGVRFTADPQRARTQATEGGKPYPYSGHHGLQDRSGDDCLFSGFRFDVFYVHDLTVENSTGNVFMQGSGVDLNMDHHSHIPMENLYTELDLNAGTRPWNSGGSQGPKAAARETFWNIASEADIVPIDWPLINLVGIRTAAARATGATGTWIEPIAPASLEPKNLYLAQLEKRLGALPNGIRRGGSDRGEPRRVLAKGKGPSPLFRVGAPDPSASPGYYDSRGKRVSRDP